MTILARRRILTNFRGHSARGDHAVVGTLGGQYRLLFALAIVFFFLPAVFAGRPAMASDRTEKNHDIVFLVDTSSSMQSIFHDVKHAILEYVHEGQPGDNVVLISFGEKVELRIRQKISSDEDMKLIERELAGLEPNQYYTYITGALDKGMEELRLLAEKYPDHLRSLVLMSDGKNNPPEGVANPMTFDEILKKYPGLLERPTSSFFYLSLGDDPDPEVLSFMKTVKGSSFDVGGGLPGAPKRKPPLAFSQVFVEPVSIDLGTLLGPKAVATVSLAFFPGRGNLSQNIIVTGANSRFRENPSWKTIIEVSPPALNCSNKAWNRDFIIKVDSLHEGTIVGALELKPLPGQVLFIDPPEIPITMTIRQPHVEVMQEGRLEFGPIDPRRVFQETQSVLLVPNEAAAGEDFRADSDIVLPEGMTLAAKVEKQDNIRELVVTVATDESFQAAHSMTLEGAIHLSGARGAVGFSKSLIEVRIKVAPPSAGSRAISGLFSWLGKLVVPGLIIFMVALIAAAAGYWWLRLRPDSALEGKLVLLHLKGKPREKSRLVTINLHNVGKTLGRDSLTFGSSKDAGVTLPHKSVAAAHCEVYARNDRGKVRIFIEPVGRNSVIVNLQKINQPTPLSHRDMVEIGSYAFRFENPHPYKQIVVRYLDGRILKGTPASWDIESDGFSLLPRDALPGSTDETYVAFADLKAVYFVRDFDGQIGRKIVSPETQIHGTHMRLTFHDGEVLEGYTSENYTETSPRFYFFPADQSGNTISLVVERHHLKKTEILAAKK